MPNEQFISSNLIFIFSHFQIKTLLTPTQGVKNSDISEPMFWATLYSIILQILHFGFLR